MFLTRVVGSKLLMRVNTWFVRHRRHLYCVILTFQVNQLHIRFNQHKRHFFILVSLFLLLLSQLFDKSLALTYIVTHLDLLPVDTFTYVWPCHIKVMDLKVSKVHVQQVAMLVHQACVHHSRDFEVWLVIAGRKFAIAFWAWFFKFTVLITT